MESIEARRREEPPPSSSPWKWREDDCRPNHGGTLIAPHGHLPILPLDEVRPCEGGIRVKCRVAVRGMLRAGKAFVEVTDENGNGAMMVKLCGQDATAIWRRMGADRLVWLVDPCVSIDSTGKEACMLKIKRVNQVVPIAEGANSNKRSLSPRTSLLTRVKQRIRIKKEDKNKEATTSLLLRTSSRLSQSSSSSEDEEAPSECGRREWTIASLNAVPNGTRISVMSVFVLAIHEPQAGKSISTADTMKIELIDGSLTRICMSIKRCDWAQLGWPTVGQCLRLAGITVRCNKGVRLSFGRLADCQVSESKDPRLIDILEKAWECPTLSSSVHKSTGADETSLSDLASGQYRLSGSRGNLLKRSLTTHLALQETDKLWYSRCSDCRHPLRSNAVQKKSPCPGCGHHCVPEVLYRFPVVLEDEHGQRVKCLVFNNVGQVLLGKDAACMSLMKHQDPAAYKAHLKAHESVHLACAHLTLSVIGDSTAVVVNQISAAS